MTGPEPKRTFAPEFCITQGADQPGPEAGCMILEFCTPMGTSPIPSSYHFGPDRVSLPQVAKSAAGDGKVMEVGVLLFCIIVLAVLVAVLGIAGIGFLYWKSYPRVEPSDLRPVSA